MIVSPGLEWMEPANRAARLIGMDTQRWLLVAGFSLALMTAQARAEEQVQWSADVLIGDAYSFDTRTRIDHVATGRISFDGDYRTHGLEGPLHYTWRVARWLNDRGWELQLLHHKLYLKDLPSGMQALSVSHGFNIITLNRAFVFDDWRVRMGLGAVITHAEAIIGATSYDGPYELSGVATLVGIGRIVELSPRWTASAELSATLGYGEMSPSGSPELEFSILNPAVHVQLGIGYRF
jgi:hypothetical protein